MFKSPLTRTVNFYSTGKIKLLMHTNVKRINFVPSLGSKLESNELLFFQSY